MGLLNTFDMLEELLAQNQFELLPPNEEKKEIRRYFFSGWNLNICCMITEKSGISG